MEWFIQEFIRKTQRSNNILTEDDLRCRLFQFLESNNRNLGSAFNDYELHSEIRWYWDRREPWSAKLKYRSDLVYINKNELIHFPWWNIVLPSKWFWFSTYKGILELKLRRANWESNKNFIKKIQNDIDKLLEIRNKTQSREDTFFYIIVFDKKRNIEEIETHIQLREWMRVFYKYIGNSNETNN